MNRFRTSSCDLWAIGSICLSAAFLLCGYEFARSASNTLFKATFGTRSLPVVMAMTPIGVLAVLWIYGRLLSELGPRRTLFWTSIGSAGIISLTTYAFNLGFAPAIYLLFIFKEAYVVLLIEQYWSFLNSTAGENQARKYYGPITGIASIGAIAGGLLLSQLAEPLGTIRMPYFAALVLLPAAFFSDYGYRRAGEFLAGKDAPSSPREHLGLGVLSRSRMLLLILLVVLTTQVVSAMLGLRFQGILQVEIPDPDKQTAFSGAFFAGLNGVAALLQFVATPLLLKFIPIGVIHIALPIIHISACAALIVTPSVATSGTAFLLFKAFDYSIFRAAKEILYIPLSFDARYRAKEFIDVFGYRFSKGAISLVVALGQRAGLVFESAYGLLALTASSIWLALVWNLSRHIKPNPIRADRDETKG